MNRLEVTHRRLIRAVFAIPRLTPSHTVYAIASSCPLSNRLRLSSCKLIHKIRLGLAPPHALSQLSWFHQSSAATRNSLCFRISSEVPSIFGIYSLVGAVTGPQDLHAKDFPLFLLYFAKYSLVLGHCVFRIS